MEKKFDVLVVGAGPAGTATAISLGNKGISVALLDKAVFPRDKTCGDALSVDVINQLKMLSPELLEDFNSFTAKTPSYGVQIFSPDGSHIDIPFVYQEEKRCGFICRRYDFDSLLVQHAKTYGNIHVIEGCEVNYVENKDSKINAHTTRGHFTAKVVVGADGAQSIVEKNLVNLKLDKDHFSAGLRVYYEGVSQFHPENFIELHFFRGILPGYLWIFPLPDNKANVGIGMLSSVISKKKVNLKHILSNILEVHPEFEERFKDATPLESMKGFGLPLGSKKRALSGERFLLTGDAASLIDPFTGEGIGNAIRSGRVAASHIIKSFQVNDFSQTFNLQYDAEIYRRMGKEFTLSRRLQQLCKYPSLFNYVVRKANQNKHVHELLIDALAHVDKKSALTNPGFYYRLMFDKTRA